MRVIRSVYWLVRADFLERVRRTSFLIVMGVTAYAGYMMLPPLGASYTAFVIGDCRGFYNSPWVGTVFGVVASILLSLIGFYLVKNAVNRDYETRVGRIIASTPLSKSSYVMGKWLSNLSVLMLILTVLTAMAFIMQLIRAEESHIDPGALAIPLWLMALPVLAIVSAVAVLFESIPFLRRGFGHVAYFFVWMSIMMLLAGRMFISVENVAQHNDIAGLSATMTDLRHQLTAMGVDVTQGTTDLYVPTGGREVVCFVWDGIDWTIKIISGRVMWLGVGIIIALVSAVPFDRFDPARRREQRRKKRRQKRRTRRWRKRLSETKNFTTTAVENDGVLKMTDVGDNWTPLMGWEKRCRCRVVLLAELRLMFKGQQWWWYAAAAGLFIVTLVHPVEAKRQFWFSVAWLWPVLIWSSMGVRESRHRTQQIIFSSAYPMRRQLPAIWLAGVVVACLSGGGFGLRLILEGESYSLFAWVVGAMFVPSLALVLGVWTRTSRVFEIVYVLLWYMALPSGVTIFDYKGVIAGSFERGVPLYYFSITIPLIILAVMGRRRQVRG